MRVREALRDVLSAKVGLKVDLDAALAEIDAAAGRAGLELRFDPTCPRVEPTVGGVRGAIGRILVEVYDEMVDGIWERMKACKADDCRWVFLDTSKNRTRAWCSMESCGNRAKVHAYRQRHSPPTRTTNHSFGAEPAQTCSQAARIVVSNDNERRETCAELFRCSPSWRRSRLPVPPRQLPALRSPAAERASPGGGYTGCKTISASHSSSAWLVYSVKHVLVVSYCKRLGVITSISIAAHYCDVGGLVSCSTTAAWKTGGGVGSTWATFEAHAQWTVTPLHIYNNTDVLGLTVPTIDG